MPILPPSGTSPLDNATVVLNAAKVMLGQKTIASLSPISGKLLDWTEPGSQQLYNSAWRRLQQRLSNGGFTQLKGDIVILGIPAVTTTDPAIPQSISWTQFFDGTNYLNSPTLPFDMACPLKLFERPNGMNSIWPRDAMELMYDGLRGLPKNQLWNREWEWRSAAIYIPGSLQVMDFRLVYQRGFGDFVDDGVTHWYETGVPISDCLEAFSAQICAGIMGTPQNPNAGGWLEAADTAARAMLSREASMKQRGNVRRQSRSGRLESGW